MRCSQETPHGSNAGACQERGIAYQSTIPNSATTFYPGLTSTQYAQYMMPYSTGLARQSSHGSAVYDDLPNFRGTPGVVILCIFILLITSLFSCLGRTDFNFVLYLLGYHIWCVEGDLRSTAGLKRLLRGARQFAVLLTMATLADLTWNFIAYSTWMCDKEQPEICFPEVQNQHVRRAYGMHSFALSLSAFNLMLKVSRLKSE